LFASRLRSASVLCFNVIDPIFAVRVPTYVVALLLCLCLRSGFAAAFVSVFFFGLIRADGCLMVIPLRNPAFPCYRVSHFSSIGGHLAPIWIVIAADFAISQRRSGSPNFIVT